MNKNPLVSVVVLTYNTGQTIIHTLNSIYNQTYKNIELIISDDASADNTIEIIQEWLKGKDDRFVNCQFLQSKRNVGTCKNINKGINIAHGEWIKTIGDDILVDIAIDKYVDYVMSHKDCKMCVSRMELVGVGDIPEEIMSKYRQQWDYFFYKASECLEKQQSWINKELVFTGPTYFFSRELYNEVGGFDESYILLEERPFCKKVLYSGYRIHTIDEVLVKYQVNMNSVCHKRGKYDLPNRQLVLDDANMNLNDLIPEMMKRGDYLYAIDRLLYHKGMLIRIYFNNNIISLLLAKLLYLFSPYRYLRQLYRLFGYEERFY